MASEKWFEGQYCFHCKEPIWGRGMVDSTPDGLGMAPYHLTCHETSLKFYLGSCALIKLTKLTHSPNADTWYACALDIKGFGWYYELKFDGQFWRDGRTQGILKYINDENFLLIRIADE